MKFFFYLSQENTLPIVIRIIAFLRKLLIPSGRIQGFREFFGGGGRVKRRGVVFFGGAEVHNTRKFLKITRTELTAYQELISHSPRIRDSLALFINSSATEPAIDCIANILSRILAEGQVFLVLAAENERLIHNLVDRD